MLLLFSILTDLLSRMILCGCDMWSLAYESAGSSGCLYWLGQVQYELLLSVLSLELWTAGKQYDSIEEK